MSHLLSIRTNTNFSIDYETKQLKPQVEIIFLITQPKYSLDKKNDIVKGHEVKEMRFNTSLEGINALIGQLQVTIAGLNQMEQIGSGLNEVIKQATKTNPQ